MKSGLYPYHIPVSSMNELIWSRRTNFEESSDKNPTIYDPINPSTGFPSGVKINVNERMWKVTVDRQLPPSSRREEKQVGAATPDVVAGADPSPRGRDVDDTQCRRKRGIERINASGRARSSQFPVRYASQVVERKKRVRARPANFIIPFLTLFFFLHSTWIWPVITYIINW